MNIVLNSIATLYIAINVLVSYRIVVNEKPHLGMQVFWLLASLFTLWRIWA